MNRNAHVQRRVSENIGKIVQKLCDTTWGSSASALIASSLCLLNLEVAFCLPIKLNSWDTHLVDTHLNQTMRMISDSPTPEPESGICTWKLTSKSAQVLYQSIFQITVLLRKVWEGKTENAQHCLVCTLGKSDGLDLSDLHLVNPQHNQNKLRKMHLLFIATG